MYKFIVSLTIFFCFTNVETHAQTADTGSLSGTIVDTISHNLTKATVTLIDAKDTTKKWQQLSNDAGRFSFTNLPIGLFSLHISYLGYEVVDKYVGLTQAKPNLDIGDIALQQTINDIGTVVVTAVLPVILRGDTTEFNASSFGVKPNAVAEDLLKKLPGVEVDQSGNITANGEKVTRVFVDGKRFFGNDPKLATENLPTDVIDKIQVFDGKSDQNEFTGFDDGNTIKTINIVTKSDKRHGWFGKSSIGGGAELEKNPKALYNANARIFYFNGDERVTLLGQLNNVNQQAFTRGDQSNNNGITKTATVGLNFADKFGQKTDFSGSYFYNNIHTTAIQNANIQKLYGDTTTNTIQTTNNNHSNLNNRVNLNWDTKFDSANELRVRPDISFINSSNNNSSISSMFNPVGDHADSLNKTIANTSSKNNGYSGSIGLTYNHKFKKKGKTLSLDVQLNGSNTDGSGTNRSLIHTFANDKDSLINQQYTTTNNSKSISTTLAYTEPIARYQMLKIEYNNSISHSKSNRQTYDIDTLTGERTSNYDLTNIFDNTYNSNHATLSYMYSKDKINLTLSDGIQFGHNESDNLSKNYPLSRSYINMYPSANFRYKFNNAKQLQINYQGRTNQPSIGQLQPIVDNSNPLSITAGNPDLKQSFTHTMLLRYRNIDRQSFKSFSAYLNASYTSNPITNTIWLFSNGGDSSNYTNFGNTVNLFGYANWSLPLKTPKSILNLASRISYGRAPSLVNDTANFTTNTSFQQTIKWSTNLKEMWDINLSTTPAYTIANYKSNTASRMNQNRNANYYSQSIIFDGTWYDKKGWELASTFNYTFYRGNTPGANVSIPLWTASVGKLFLKNRAGEIKLSVYDLLNQNKGISFTRTANVISQTQTNILRRYFLLTFTYNLRQFGGKNNNRRNSNGEQWQRDGGDRGGFGGGKRGGF